MEKILDITQRCETHAPIKPYAEHMEWMDTMIAKGEELSQCDKCGRWFFKEEM